MQCTLKCFKSIFFVSSVLEIKKGIMQHQTYALGIVLLTIYDFSELLCSIKSETRMTVHTVRLSTQR